MVFFVCPVVTVIVMALVKYPVSSATGSAGIAFMEFYGFTNALITIYFVRPYKEYTKGRFRALLRSASGGRWGNEDTLIVQSEPTVSVHTTRGP